MNQLNLRLIMASIGNDIRYAEELLRADQVVAIPTETVYGLAGNALSEQAILQIFEIKNRPKFDPLIAHIDSVDKVRDIVNNIPDQALDLMEAFWPGPLTFLLDKDDKVPDLLTSGHPRVAVRLPNHPMTRSLLSMLDFPLAAPSANPFGYVSPTSALHVNDQLGEKLAYILDGGECKVGVESTIVGFQGKKTIVHRLGGIALEDLKQVVGAVEEQMNVSSNPAAPGMLKSHYSPGRKLVLGDIAQKLSGMDPNSTGVISFTDRFEVPKENSFVLSPSGDLNEAARNIFKALRQMDDPGIKVILAELLPEKGLGRAINDRLRRAAA